MKIPTAHKNGYEVIYSEQETQSKKEFITSELHYGELLQSAFPLVILLMYEESQKYTSCEK